MTIIEELIDVFRDVEIGTEFTRSEIVQRVHSKFGRNTDSVIPSDYCYNRLNNGINHETQPHLFEYTSRKTYIYLGLNYPYTGKIYHKPKGCPELCVGEMLDGIVMPYPAHQSSHTETTDKVSSTPVHKTKRDISLQLRYQILKRDNFKCCACGTSPAKIPSVELHIDHIIPWSKGGETTLENLQTLCSKCNLGKCDLL